MDRIDLLKITAECTKEIAEFVQVAFYNERIDEETIREKMRTIGETLVNGSKLEE